MSKHRYAGKELSWFEMLLQLTLLRRCDNGVCITWVLDVVAGRQPVHLFLVKIPIMWAGEYENEEG